LKKSAETKEMSAKTLSSIRRLVDDVLADATNGTDRATLRRLTSVFGAALLTRACQIVDAANVTRLLVDDECRLVEVRSVTM